MSVYARVAGGVVVEMFTPPTGFSLADCFAPPVAAQFVAVPAGADPAVGWSAVEAGGGFTFTPAASATPTLAQQAAAMLGAGISVASTANPGVSGVYAADPQSRANIAAISLYAQVNGKFPRGETTKTLLDVNGAPRVFPSVAVFQEFATVFADTADALIEVTLGLLSALPAQPAMMP